MPSKKNISKLCKICKEEFFIEKNRESTAKYCSTTCRQVGTKGRRTPLNRVCDQCKKLFKGFKGQRWKFCTRDCYDTYRFNLKPCKECFSEINKGERCPKHAIDKQIKWRLTASKQELKAKSMQSSYRHATGNLETLTLIEARKIIQDPPTCIYCEKPVLWNELSIDHKQPLSRGGSNKPDNLVWVHLSCNMIKGSMNMVEFIDFLSFIRKHPQIEEYLIPRLKSGGGAIYGRKK